MHVEQLSMADHNEVAFDEVEAARVEGREAFHKVFFIICADYCDDDEARNDLLAPIEDQQRRIARYVDRRGEIPQVDPESGEPTEPTAEEPEEEATASGDEAATAGAGTETSGGASSTGPAGESASGPEGGRLSGGPSTGESN